MLLHALRIFDKSEAGSKGGQDGSFVHPTTSSGTSKPMILRESHTSSLLWLGVSKSTCSEGLSFAILFTYLAWAFGFLGCRKFVEKEEMIVAVGLADFVGDVEVVIVGFG